MKNKYLISFIIFTMIFSLNSTALCQTISMDNITFQDDKVIKFDMELRSLNVPHGKAQLISLPNECKTISIGDPEVCDVVMMDGSDFLLIGKNPGQTNIYVWLINDIKLESAIKVYDNTDTLEKLLKNILPYEEDITVSIAHNTIILSGYVNKATSIENAQKIAEAYMNGRETTQSIDVKVINMLKVKNEHQILLEVRLAEVIRSKSDDSGFDWRYTGDIFDIPSDISYLDGGTPAYHGGNDSFLEIPGTNGGQGTSLGAFVNNKGNKQFAYGLDFLVSRGLAKIIAKPNLLVRNGEEASFLAGGEFPVPVQDEDSVRIEWKEFGVKLIFTPNLDERDNIELVLAPEVSVLDFTEAAVTVNGFEIPALKTRKTETKVILRDGESFYVSGLISQNESDTLSEMPGISNIPIIGNLFKNKNTSLTDTELVVFVTPRIIKPFKKYTEKNFDDTEKLKLLTNSVPVPFEQPHGDAIKEFIEQGEKPQKSLEQIRQEEIEAEMERIRKQKEMEKEAKKQNKKTEKEKIDTNKHSTKTNIKENDVISITMDNPFVSNETEETTSETKKTLPWYKRLFKRKNTEEKEDLTSVDNESEMQLSKAIIREQETDDYYDTEERKYAIATSERIEIYDASSKQSYLDEICDDISKISELQK